MSRIATTTLAAALGLTACVKGNPDLPPVSFDGGSLALPECGYTVVNRVGAEAPQRATADIGDDPTPRQVRLGLIGDPRTSVVVQWRDTDENTKASTVRFGEGGAVDQTATGLTYLFESGVNGNGGEIRMHEAHLCGLKPDTAYSYQVGAVDGAGADHFSTVATFRTAPDIVANPDAEVVIAVVGDSRDGATVLSQVATLLAGKAPDLILFSGDAVTLGVIQPEWEEFFDAAEPLFKTAPVVSAHGNHEANAINYYAQFAMPGDEENYALDYGFAHLTVLNDTPIDDAAILGSTKTFLDADLTAHDSARWKLVMHHQPIWSASTRHGSSTTLRDAWGPVFDAHAVDLVLSGHDHDYERSKPMKGSTPQATPAEGTVYMVSGGAGAEIYDNGTDFWTQYSEKTHGAAIIHVRKNTMTVDVFHPDGSMIDTFSETKP
jgi:hypothetical protein